MLVTGVEIVFSKCLLLSVLVTHCLVLMPVVEA